MAPSVETVSDNNDKFYVHTVVNPLISSPKIAQLKTEVRRDQELLKLRETVKTGWAAQKSLLNPEIHEYWAVKDEIREQDGLIVPKAMQAEMLVKIHELHLGSEKCKRRARYLLYWPGMNDQITQTVSKCEVCASTDGPIKRSL